MKTIKEFIRFLNKLERAGIHYELSKIRDDSILVTAIVPGERWEIEFMIDEAIEVERFKSNGTISDKKEIDILFKNFSN